MATSQAHPDSAAPVILRARELHKTFRMGESEIAVLSGLDVTIRAGEFLAIEGRSGSGKSTLLHLLGALDEPNDGRIEYENSDLAALASAERSRIRNEHFGFVFQFYHLLPELSVMENTMLAAMVKHSWLRFRRTRSALRDRAREILSKLQLEHRLNHRPNQLSGGERQRVAIARALMNQPKVVFADEPTGNLDYETGRQIMNVLETLHREMNQTIVMVTHDRALAREADRVLVLKAGKLHAAEA